MTPSTHLTLTATETLVAQFFWRSQGQWHSDRRYYTLPDGDTKSLTSLITVQFLPQGSSSLLELAQLHQLDDDSPLCCGSLVRWESQDAITGKAQSSGETVFGALGSILYRDRGFATPNPVTATFRMPDADTLCLRTEYKGSVFEEELKLIGQRYRTRQTIISRAGEQVMIGQYLEKRI